MKHIFCSLSLILLPLSLPLAAFANNHSKKPTLDVKKTLRVRYISSPWNQDSSKIDTANIFVKDIASQHIVKILLSETEPDSSDFTGSFLVNWTSIDKIKPEVYIPPENIRNNLKAEQSFIKQIKDGKATRMPVLFKKATDGEQSLDVYDTKEQAQQAFKTFLEKTHAEKEKNKLLKPIPSKAEEETAKLRERKMKLAELATEGLQRQEQRIRLEQLERQKRLELIKKQKEMDKAQKEKRKQKAQELAQKALELYKQAKFKDAEKLFKKSIELDPEDKSYYFKYAVTLYRNEKYNEALVIFNITEVDPNTNIEKEYYMGLIHFRLKELDAAQKNFAFVRASKHEIMSPSAAFYLGIIHFTNEEYEQAKEPFEYVIDTSKDPQLDEKAEDYLEKIANAIAFQKLQKKKNNLTVTFGANYDSNVLFVPDNQVSTSASNKAGLRFLTNANYDYTFFYKEANDLHFNTNFLYFYSLSKDFCMADPMLITTSLPYTHKGTYSDKAYKLTVSPGYERLYMDENDDCAKEDILNSMLLNTDVTFIMRNNWFASYTLNIRQDDSLSSTSVGTSDADALQYSLQTKQSFFLDKSRKTALITGLGYTLNNANGTEKKYNQIDFNASYSRPFIRWKDTSWTTGITYYKLTYTNSADGRTDSNFSLSYSTNSTLNDWLTWGTTSSYTVNNSTSTSNQYNKYSIMLTMTLDIDEWYGAKYGASKSTSSH